ncbi:MAG TPA: ATP-binding protein [Candidatus Limnocylindria bacterium]
MRLSRLARALLATLIGILAAVIPDSIAGISGQDSPILVSCLLAVGLVGLSLGPWAALWTYASAGVVIVGLALPVGSEPMGSGDVLRLAIYIVGAPFEIMLAMRAERDRELSAHARERGLAAESEARRDRQTANLYRDELAAAVRDLQHERRRLEEVAEAIPEALVVYDAEGRGTYGNRAALRSLGRSFFDVDADTWGRVTEPRDEAGSALDRDDWPQLRAQHEASRRRMTVRMPMSGRDMLVDAEGTPLPGGGAVLLFRDVGREADERRRLSAFASFVAHELRNPLAVAKARMELAGRDPAMPERARSHSSRAHESVDAAIEILERLELFSRAESGRLEAIIDPFDLRVAVDAAVERVRARGSDREVRVTCIGEPTVAGDRRLTEQAITNLLINADRYSAPEAPIDVEIRGGERPSVRVADAGPGIPAELATIVFRERVSSGRGLGIGLYLVRAAMEAQAGTVTLEQGRPRAIFCLEWPTRPAGPERAAADPDEISPDDATGAA